MAYQTPTAPECTPDDFLTQERLDVFFNDFKTGISAALPPSSIFSHLVNDVRQLYMSRLLTLQREIIRRSERQTEQLSELREKYEALLSQVNSGQERTIPRVYTEGPATRESPAVEILPAQTHTVHIGTDLSPQRDMVCWENLNRSGWTERFEFKAFKFVEIGTVKITIGEKYDAPHRVHAFLSTSTIPVDWKERLHFYAYESWRPNTVMISVGQSGNPQRCIFMRGDHAYKLNDWVEIFVFWVPL